MSKLAAINREIKKIDRNLIAKKSDSGKVEIFEKSLMWEAYEFQGVKIVYSKPVLKWATSLTHNWSASGRPVDWGIDHIVNRINSIDREKFYSFYDEMNRKREEDVKLQERARKNEYRAIAADMRRDFAKATNDVNTSTIDKEIKYGY